MLETPARPELKAHREATTTAFSDLIRQLVNILGKKLTAYIGGVKDVRAVDRWGYGADPYKDADVRLRFAFQVAKTLREHDDKRVVQAWFTGLNPELDDRVPIRLIREENLDTVGPEILRAARSFVAGG